MGTRSSDSEGKNCVEIDPAEEKPHVTRSDELVAELLKDVEQSEKPFSVDDITAGKEVKKKHKDHKHKKSKKKKRRHSRSRSRSRSRDKRKHSSSKRSKRRRSRSCSNSSQSGNSRNGIAEPLNNVKVKPMATDPTIDQVSEDDDLPVGADFRTVMREAKMTINIPNSSAQPLDLSLLPSDPGCSVPKKLIESFPLAKESSRNTPDDSDRHGSKNQSELLQRVIETKGKGDFVPRNLKVKTSVPASTPETATKPASTDKVDEGSNNTVNARSPVEEFGPSPPPVLAVPPDESKSNSDAELERKIEMQIAEKEDGSAKSDRWTKIIESCTAAIDKKISDKSRSRRHRSSSPDTDEEIKRRVRPSGSRYRKRTRSRSPHRKSERKRSRRRSRSGSRKRSSSRRKRSRSPEKSRRRSPSPEKSRKRRSRSRERTRGQRVHSRSRSPANRSSRTNSSRRDRDGIDKAKLLEIARSRAQRAKAMGLFDTKDTSNKSIDDFVSYCEKVQKKQEREDRRDKGEQVSSDEEETMIDKRTFKHPFGIRPSEGIKINIVNSTPLATKTAQECILDSSQLRIVFPVSSGAIHKENTAEWKRVEKETVPSTCSGDQKKFVAMTSLAAEKLRATSVNNTGAQSSVGSMPANLPLLPPPPPPPAALHSSPLQKQTAFDFLLPPPPPLPPMLVVPSKEDMIMSEIETSQKSAPKDVARVLAQRAKAQRSLGDDPNNFESLRLLKDANDQMSAWAAARHAPGQFTGSTGVSVLAPEALQPHDSRYHAWVRKDMFKTARPAVGGMGMRLMQKMGWRLGEGLGKDCSGNVEPLTLDVKSDRKGLLTEEDLPARTSAKSIRGVAATDMSGKNPVSLVMELCTKRRWDSPSFQCIESGPPNSREFLWKVVVNGVEYQPVSASRNKKTGKAVACQVVLQSLGLVPRDASLPIVI